MEEFRRVSRWLYQSEHYTVHSVTILPHGRWKVVHRVVPVETIGFAGTISDAMDLADEDARWRSSGQYLTGGQGHGRMEVGGQRKDTPMTDTPVFNTCKCYSIVAEDTDHEGSTFKVYMSCGSTIPRKRTFKPGHDAKLKSVLLAAFRAGEEIHYMDGGMLVSVSPMQMAKERGWDHFMTPAKPKKVKASKDDGEVFAGDRGELDPDTLTEAAAHGMSEAEYELTRMAQEEDAPAPMAGFNPARVKVGRWWKEGMVVSQTADEVTVRVTNKHGDDFKDHTLPRDSDKLDLG